MRARRRCLALPLFIATLTFSCAALAAPMSDAEIRRVLKERVGELRPGASIVVGIIDRNGKRVIAQGVTDRKNKRPADGNTVYEIGSVTKVFTSLLLADMAVKGELQASDPVEKYLPATVAVPGERGRKITLLDLAQHRSGLPREPSNRKVNARGETIGAYTTNEMYRFLSGYQLEIPIGTPLYSNLGFELLGLALSLRAGKEFDALVQERITGPLDMRSTGMVATSDMRRRRAIGYRDDGSVAPDEVYLHLAGAGDLQSTVNDLLRFLEACMQTSPTPIDGALTRMNESGAGSGRPGWDRVKAPNSEIWFKNGRTYGYSSFIGYEVGTGTGVVLLSNSSVPADDIALKSLDNKFRLKQLKVPAAFEKAMEASGFREVLAGYRAFKHRDPNFFLDEGPLNEWGYALLEKRKFREAIEVLRLGVHLRPKSFNTHDSLAEAYEREGQIELAAASYQTSLKLNPGNLNAVTRLKALGTTSSR